MPLPDSQTNLSEKSILDALRGIRDPDLGDDIVSLGFVKNILIEGGKVSFIIELTTPACPVKDQFKQQAHDAVMELDGVDEVDVVITADTSRQQFERANPIPGVKYSIAVASGKGGVGKSTVAANLAVALARDGAAVGLMDADIYGPSIPIMFGINERPQITEEKKIIPIEKYGIKLMSLGFIADERTPVIWRGPLVGKMVQEFLSNVEWGELDYLIIDLPPGTGDAQLTLVQSAPLSGAVVVTTPQKVALEDVIRALKMFERVDVHIVGLVENMAYFVCGSCGERHDIFSSGGGAQTAEELGIPFVGEIPLNASICEGGDAGVPAVVADEQSEVGQAFIEIARSVAANTSAVTMKKGLSQKELAEISHRRDESDN